MNMEVNLHLVMDQGTEERVMNTGQVMGERPTLMSMDLVDMGRKPNYGEEEDNGYGYGGKSASYGRSNYETTKSEGYGTSTFERPSYERSEEEDYKKPSYGRHDDDDDDDEGYGQKKYGDDDYDEDEEKKQCHKHHHHCKHSDE